MKLNRKLHIAPIPRCQGFTMVEVLVSFILLVVTMVGLAAMQNSSTRYDYQAYLRSQAVSQVVDMVDRMRANPAGVVAGSYTVETMPTEYSMDCADSGNECTPAELAAYDLVVWNASNGSTLPGGVGDVEVIAPAANRNYQVSVFWTEQRDKELVGEGYTNPCDGGSNESLHCYQLMVRL